MGRNAGGWALAALALLILLLPGSVQAAPETRACQETSSVSLYLDASRALSMSPPSSEGSAGFQARIGGPLVWLVGSWRTGPLPGDLTYGGSCNCSVWASSSSPGQLRTRFQVYVGLNDMRPSTAINTDSASLGSTPKEFIGSGDVSLHAKSGDTITVWIYVSERGSGGQVVFGGNYPSRIMLDLQPLSLNLSISSRPGELKVSGSVSDVWGADDISNITIAIMGPFSGGNTSQCGRELYEAKSSVVKAAKGDDIKQTSTNVSELEISYTWRYDKTAIKAGQYVVAVMVDTHSNASKDADARIPLAPSKAGFSFGGSGLLFGLVIVIAALALVGASLYYNSKGKAAGVSFSDNRKAVMAAGVAALLVVAAVGMALTFTPPATSGGEKAPDFKLKDVNGKTVSLSGYRGSVVVLDMMATWCPTCNQEIPELTSFHKAHSDVTIISIDVDKSENGDQLKKHMESKGASWTYCMDDGSVLKNYHVTNIPTIVIVNAAGQITFLKADLVKADELGRLVAAAKSGSAPILAIGGEMGFAMLAFLAGISAFFSPCAFPLLPGYMTYYIGRKEESMTDRKAMVRRAALGGLAAALGIILVYALIGLPASLAGEVIKPFVGMLAPLVAAIILIMGAIMLTNYDLPFYRVTALFAPVVDGARNALRKATGKEPNAPKGYYSGLMGYGAGYGAASLGCHAPIFIAVLMAGLAAGGFAAGIAAFMMYGLGMGVLMVAVTVLVGMAKVQLVKKLQHLMPVIKKVSGLVLVVVGIILIYYYVTSLG